MPLCEFGVFFCLAKFQDLEFKCSIHFNNMGCQFWQEVFKSQAFFTCWIRQSFWDEYFVGNRMDHKDPIFSFQSVFWKVKWKQWFRPTQLTNHRKKWSALWGRNHTRQTRRFIWKKAREVSVRDPKIYTFGRARNGIGWHKKGIRTVEMGRNGLLPNFYCELLNSNSRVSWCLFDNWTRYI